MMIRIIIRINIIITIVHTTFAITITTTLIVLLKSLVMSHLPIKPRVITMLAQGEGHTNDLVCKWGGAAPPPTPPLFKGHGCLQKKTRVRSSPPSMFAPKNKHQVVAMWIIHFCSRGSYAGRLVCKWGGGLRPPNPPAF